MYNHRCKGLEMSVFLNVQNLLKHLVCFILVCYFKIQRMMNKTIIHMIFANYFKIHPECFLAH